MSLNMPFFMNDVSLSICIILCKLLRNKFLSYKLAASKSNVRLFV